MIAGMVNAGYPKKFAAGILCNAGTLGILIPPSIVMVVYCAVTEQSVGRIFLAGIVPGLLLSIMMMVAIYIYARIKKLPSLPKATFKETLVSAKEAIPGFFLLFIIMGGIYGGVFTPTEAAAVAAVYAVFVSLFIYKDITVKDLPRVFVDSSKTTVKETTIHEGNGGYIEGRQTGYVNNNNKMKTTLRQTLPTEDTARNINNTTYYSTYVYDPSIVAKTTVKETTVDLGGSKYGFLGGFLNSLFGGYLMRDDKAKNTQRQYSHIDNYGIAAGGVSTFVPRDREAEYNAEIDGTREMLMIKAGYTPNGGGKFVGVPKEDINMVINKKQIDLEESARIGNMGLAYEGLPVPIERENITKEKYVENAYNNRLDSSILSTLVNNENIIKINPIRLDCESI